jgi:hypothetical protein
MMKLRSEVGALNGTIIELESKLFKLLGSGRQAANTPQDVTEQKEKPFKTQQHYERRYILTLAVRNQRL